MENFRENYIKAREIIADELKQKYNLVESYRDNSRLTLDSTNHSIHLTFFVPDGSNISVSDVGKEPGHGNNFMYYLYEKHPNDQEREKILKELYRDTRATGPFDLSAESIEDDLKAMIGYITESYPDFFL